MMIMNVLTTSTISFNIWSWHHLYRPSACAVWRLLKISLSDSTSPHYWHEGLFVFFHKWRFTGLGRVSYTDCIRNFMGISLCHKSDHLIFRLTIDSHLVQAPCCLNPTIFPILISSSPLRLSPCRNCYFSLPATLSTLIEGKYPRPAWPVATMPRSLSSAIFNSFAVFHFFPL